MKMNSLLDGLGQIRHSKLILGLKRCKFVHLKFLGCSAQISPKAIQVADLMSLVHLHVGVVPVEGPTIEMGVEELPEH